jgi:magnesium transporter
MVHFYVKVDGLLAEIKHPEPGCWVNIKPPFSTDEMEGIAKQFEIPLDFLIDSLDVDERSRYEVEDDCRLILINSPILNTSEEENDAIYMTVPIGIIISPEHVFTITTSDNPVLAKFLENKIRNFDPSDAMFFLILLLEQNVYRFLTCLKKLDLRRNLIERELYHASRNKELKQLLSIEKSLVYILNSLSANDLLMMKMKRVDFLSIRSEEEKMDLFEDIIIDNGQALEMANVYSNILSGTMDTYASIISNNMNVTIHRLTLVTIFLAVPTLIASFFGMNVPLPLSKSPAALPIIVVFATTISFLLSWIIQKKRFF